MSRHGRAFDRAQAAYDAQLPPEYWDDEPCDGCAALDCDDCEYSAPKEADDGK